MTIHDVDDFSPQAPRAWQTCPDADLALALGCAQADVLARALLLARSSGQAAEALELGRKWIRLHHRLVTEAWERHQQRAPMLWEPAPKTALPRLTEPCEPTEACEGCDLRGLCGWGVER